MKIYALYYNKKFIAAYPTKEECKTYGIDHGLSGWDCEIKEMQLHDPPTIPHNYPINYPNRKDTNIPFTDYTKWTCASGPQANFDDIKTAENYERYSKRFGY